MSSLEAPSDPGSWPGTFGLQKGNTPPRRVLYSERVNTTSAKIETFRHLLAAQTASRAGGLKGGLPSAVAKAAAVPPMRSGQGATDDGLEGFRQDSVGHISRPGGLEELHRRGITGKGVTVAVVDSGVAKHADFGERLKAFKDFSSSKRAPHDPKGHGTHVAGIILGDGPRIDGVAPEADLVALRISSEKEAIQAVDWVIAHKDKYSIDVLNLSLGVDAKPNPQDDHFRLAAERAVEAGLVVVVSAGNECKGGVCPATISSPGNSPKVITVGAIDDGGTASLKDDKIWDKSSQGTRSEGKPDLVAPGTGVVSVLAPGSVYADRVAAGSEYLSVSGSSQAAPMVSGAAALLLQVNPSLTHDEIKAILTDTADPIRGARKLAQGAGRLDLPQAVEVASSMKPRRRAAV